MRRWLSRLCMVFLGFLAMPAFADKLAVVVPLVADDLAAVAALKATPDKHVMLYFGDELN